MNRNITLSFAVLLTTSLSISANDASYIANRNDTIQSVFLNEVIITSSTKETNPLQTLPGSVSVLSSSVLNEMQIDNIKNVSSIVPNFFIPDYGSKMTAPVYIRGIGNRSAGQAAGMYVDGAPYLNKSSFDYEFENIQRLEILRGPQGTLFGRNSMGGIIHVFTSSPLEYQKTDVLLRGGNYGAFLAKAAGRYKINEKTGISAGGYYDHQDGYFTNEYTGKKTDPLDAAGGKIRFDWKISNAFKAYYTLKYDYVNQGAFPYGAYSKTTATVAPVNYNDPGDYNRKLLDNVLHLEYKNEHILFSSVTAFQTLKDDMNMDQDFSPQPVFTLNQAQDQKTITQEFSIKSNNNKNYQWTWGLYGFQDMLTTRALVEMKEGGIASIQTIFDRIKDEYPRAPVISVADELIPIPGTYKTPGMGGAIYHQSTYNNLFTKGLSITAGMRLDYNKNELNYDAQGAMNLSVAPPGPIPPTNLRLDSILLGNESMRSFEILPKIALKYEWNRKTYIYASAAKGYNSGGYNVQVFSELTKNALMSQAAQYAPAGTVPVSELSVNKATPYDPEYSWTYEAGFKGEIIRDVLSTTVAVFYINIDDMQLTKFIDSGEGRMLANVGKAVNKGFEIGLNAKLLTGLYTGINYGYTHAMFKDYSDEKTDYSGKYLPYVPQQTLSIYGSFTKKFHNQWIDQFNCYAQYNGSGKIYWTENNDIAQQFYGLLNLKAGVSKGICSLHIWTKNALDKRYNAFYFESMGNAFLQQGKPFTIGVDLGLHF